MSRHTKLLEDGQAVMDCENCGLHLDGCHLYRCRNRLKDRLAAYEDTGLEPEEIRKVQAALYPIIKQLIDKAPTIEAEPVRHGEWRIFRDECVLLAECSECGTVHSGIAAAQWDYCPVCGSKMDGDSHD